MAGEEQGFHWMSSDSESLTIDNDDVVMNVKYLQWNWFYSYAARSEVIDIDSFLIRR
jgi:heme/copper-type cytochrome/quinol oxidase subunit 2